VTREAKARGTWMGGNNLLSNEVASKTVRESPQKSFRRWGQMSGPKARDIGRELVEKGENEIGPE
jgi:hypothetical protein